MLKGQNVETIRWKSWSLGLQVLGDVLGSCQLAPGGVSNAQVPPSSKPLASKCVGQYASGNEDRETYAGFMKLSVHRWTPSYAKDKGT